MKIQKLREMLGKRRVFERILTWSSVATLSACVALALHVSSTISDYLSLRTSSGVVVTIRNARMNADGWYENLDNPRFTAEIGEVIQRNYPPATAVSPIVRCRWDRIEVGDVLYSVRNLLATGDGYDEVVGLKMTAGTFFNAADVEEGRRVVVISESVASDLFGNAEAAVGSSITAHYMIERPTRDDGEIGRYSSTYTVLGVFEDPVFMFGDLYGISDMMIPVTQHTGPGDWVDAFMARVSGEISQTAPEQLESIVERHLEVDDSCVVFLGRNPGTQSTIRGSNREILRIELFFGTIAGVALLIVAIGLSAVMTIHTIEREREFGIKRAIGATRLSIMGDVCATSVVVASVGSCAGVLIAVVLAPTVIDAVQPILYTDGNALLRMGIRVTMKFSTAVTTLLLVGFAGLAAALLPGVTIAGSRPSEHLRGNG